MASTERSGKRNRALLEASWLALASALALLPLSGAAQPGRPAFERPYLAQPPSLNPLLAMDHLRALKAAANQVRMADPSAAFSLAGLAKRSPPFSFFGRLEPRGEDLADPASGAVFSLERDGADLALSVASIDAHACYAIFFAIRSALPYRRMGLGSPTPDPWFESVQALGPRARVHAEGDPPTSALEPASAACDPSKASSFALRAWGF